MTTSRLFEKWNVYSNFYLLHEISRGIQDTVMLPPKILLGMIKKEDVEWLMHKPRSGPESKRFFAHEILYRQDSADFTMPFRNHFVANTQFWLYATRFPFWDPLPQFYSNKNGRYRDFRVYDWEPILSKIWNTITCFEKLWTGAKVGVKNKFLKRMGLEDASMWSPSGTCLPANGKEWVSLCEFNNIRLRDPSLK